MDRGLVEQMWDGVLQGAEELLEIEIGPPKLILVDEGQTMGDIAEHKALIAPIIEKGAFASYFHNAIALLVKKKPSKKDNAEMLDTMFHELLHHVNEQVWQETDTKLSPWKSTWAREAIVERTVIYHLPKLFYSDFLDSVGIACEDVQNVASKRIETAASTAGLFFVYLLDGIANYDCFYNYKRDLFLPSLSSPDFAPIKPSFNQAVGLMKDSYSEYPDAFHYLVNAPIPEIAIHFLIENVKDKRFNGRSLADIAGEARAWGLGAKNVILGENSIESEYDWHWSVDYC